MRFKQYLQEMQEDFLTDMDEVKDWLAKHYIQSSNEPKTSVLVDRKGVTNIVRPPTSSVDFTASNTLLLGKDHLPVKFGMISCNLNIWGLPITNFKGFPEEIYGAMAIYNMPQELSCEYFPREVKRLRFVNCKAIDLTGIQDYLQHVESGQIAFADATVTKGGIGLLMIKGLNKIITSADMDAPFQIISKYIGRPDDIFDCQAELIENGFEQFAQL